MSAQPQHYKVTPDSDLQRLLRKAKADRQPVILEDEGDCYHVVADRERVNLTDNPAANYDPERMIAAIHASAGVLKGVDRDELLADLRAERGQDSIGRPAE